MSPSFTGVLPFVSRRETTPSPQPHPPFVVGKAVRAIPLIPLSDLHDQSSLTNTLDLVLCRIGLSRRQSCPTKLPHLHPGWTPLHPLTQLCSVPERPRWRVRALRTPLSDTVRPPAVPRDLSPSLPDRGVEEQARHSPEQSLSPPEEICRNHYNSGLSSNRPPTPLRRPHPPPQVYTPILRALPHPSDAPYQKRTPTPAHK